MSDTVVPRGNEFTPADIERSLLALALTGGNSVRARQLLEHDQTLTRVPSEEVLRVWRRGKHAQRYQELRTEQAPAIEAAAIGDYREIMVEGVQAQLQATRRAAQGIDEMDAKDAAAAAKNLAIATGVAADKLLVFTDRPNVIHAHPDPMNTLTGLMNALGIPQTDSIPGTATELPAMPLIPESAGLNACVHQSGDSPPS